METKSSTTFIVQSGIPFSKSAGELTLDLYLPLPEPDAGLLPCVVVIQGGGFYSQDGQRFRPFAVNLAESGFAAALISYRGLPEHGYEDTLRDVRTAVRFVRKHSGKYGIDAGRIGAMGRSAGATLAMLQGLAGDSRVQPTDEELADVSSRIHAVAAISGVYDFISRFTDEAQTASQPNLENKFKSSGAWVGTPFSVHDHNWRAVSAVHHIHPAAPPCLLIHCKDDTVVPWMQSCDLHRVLTQAGVPSELHTPDQGGHEGPESMYSDMVAFFNKWL